MSRTILAAFLALLGCGQAPSSRDAANDRVSAIFANGMTGPVIDRSGKIVGKVSGRPSPDGLIVAFEVSGLTPGQHGVHLHEAGRCDAPHFTSAGAHWNTSGHEHGNDNPKGPHDGDWDDLDVGAAGTGSTDRLIPRWHSAIPEAGLSLVIHADRDDESSQPEGNSGERLACAVIIPPV